MFADLMGDEAAKVGGADDGVVPAGLGGAPVLVQQHVRLELLGVAEQPSCQLFETGLGSFDDGDVGHESCHGVDSRKVGVD